MKTFGSIKRVGRKVGTRLGLLKQRDVDLYPGSSVGDRVHLRGAVLGGNNSIGHDTSVAGNVAIGYASTIGHNCVLVGEIKIGRYCQVAPYAAAYATNHSTSCLSTYVNKRLFDRELQHHNRIKPVEVGNDVWIGHGAVILPGANIGNGAVVGASAVVTKPVPAFAIAVGNPARVVGWRFPKEIIALVEELAWWEYGSEELLKIKEVFFLDFVNDVPGTCKVLSKAIVTLKKPR